LGAAAVAGAVKESGVTGKYMIWMIGMIGAGCGVSADLARVEQADTELDIEPDPGPYKCGPSACGVNDPGIDEHGFHDLSKSGKPNGKGFQLVRFEKDGVPYKLDVVDGHLVGTRVPLVMVLAGQALVGAHLVLERSGESWTVRIARVGHMEIPVGDPEEIETYVLEYATTGHSDWRNLCGNGRGVVDPGPDAMGMKSDESILFDGDRIDLGGKTVAVDADRDWFNIGCAGHVVSKLHLTRNTLASTGGVPAAVSFPGRQATLKLLTADYCGDGTAFTVAGQRLVWRGGLVDYIEPAVTEEAHWSEHGALCLDTPRMAVPTTEEGSRAFPDIWGAIAARCHPPACGAAPMLVGPGGSNVPPPVPDVEQRVSGNPALYQ
jgi:RNase P/RNase MRP subunit p29